MLDHGSFRAVYSETAGGGCEGNVGYKEAVQGDRMIFPDLTVIDPDSEYTIDPDTFASMGRATPFQGERVKGRVIMTIHKGKIIIRLKGKKEMKDRNLKVKYNNKIADNVYHMSLEGDCRDIGRPGQFIDILVDDYVPQKADLDT